MCVSVLCGLHAPNSPTLLSVYDGLPHFKPTLTLHLLSTRNQAVRSALFKSNLFSNRSKYFPDYFSDLSDKKGVRLWEVALNVFKTNI